MFSVFIKLILTGRNVYQDQMFELKEIVSTLTQF